MLPQVAPGHGNSANTNTPGFVRMTLDPATGAWSVAGVLYGDRFGAEHFSDLWAADFLTTETGPGRFWFESDTSFDEIASHLHDLAMKFDLGGHHWGPFGYDDPL